jgi:ribosomal-protein-alanine N-acetyltransferase
MTARPTVPVLAGALACLRPLRESDRAERLALGRDAEFVRMNGGNPHRQETFTVADVDRWFRAFPESLRWAIEREGRLVGEVRLDVVDAAEGRANFAIGIFDPSERDHGLGTETTRLVLDHAFDALALREVVLRVLSFNTRAIRCYQKCGFVAYGRDRERAYVDGRWQDDLLMRVGADDYRAARAHRGAG